MSWREKLDNVRHRPNEYPGTWSLSEESARYPTAAARVTQCAEGNVTIPLRRRPGAREYRDPHWIENHRAPLSVAPLELELAQTLPDICTAHGRPALSRLPVRSIFYETGSHPRHPHAGQGPARFRAPASTIVAGEWPVCDRCIRRRQWYHGTAGVLTVVMAVNVIALIVVARVLEYKPMIMPLAFGVFPGSLPIGLVIMFLLLEKGDTRAKFQPIDDERCLRVEAHPDFEAALQRMPPSPPCEQSPPAAG